MKILITGGAGFIGSHLYEKLKKDNNNVIAVDNFFHASKNPIIEKVKYCDIRYKSDIEPYVKWSDVVFHLAAQIHVDRSIISPQETIDINVNGTLNILEAVRKYNKEMVFASTSEVYGTAQTKKIKENHPLDCQSPYAASKVAGERLAYSYYKTYGTKVAILRNFNTFGNFQNDGSYGGVIAIFTRQALQGKTLSIFGSGKQERDYMSVRDAIRGYEFLISHKCWGKPVNIGTGKTITITDLAKEIIRLTNSKSKIEYVEERPGEVMRLCADTSLAQSMGFKIRTNFKNDLYDYTKWYKDTVL